VGDEVVGQEVRLVAAEVVPVAMHVPRFWVSRIAYFRHMGLVLISNKSAKASPIPPTPWGCNRRAIVDSRLLSYREPVGGCT
jgi:hypothetical protein